MDQLPEFPVREIKKRSNEELDEIAQKGIKPILDQRAKMLGTDKTVITEQEKIPGTPPTYPVSGKLEDKLPPEEKPLTDGYSKKDIESLQRKWGGNWGVPKKKGK